MHCPFTSIAGLLDGPVEEMARHLDLLVPDALRRLFGLPEPGRWGNQAAGVHRWSPGPRPGTLRVEVWPAPEGEDPALALDLADHQFGKLEAAWIALNDVEQPRYDLDRDARGGPIPLGSIERNLAEERRALADGLAPNQVRPGLRMFRPLIRCLEEFAVCLGADTLNVVPLAYHNAIQYERYGFTYASEEVELEEIHRRFQPGGDLRARMDGSTPFRLPAMGGTVRGRSWAIHDGILGRRWVPPPMYKFTERDFHTCTFPGAVW
ncbi:MAG: hypothetical protein P1P84_11175 [Deferrisomatales bacterium]|nr:hypothetical protein [Deferrisomatales bacterium]